MTAPAVVSYRDAIEAAGRLKAAADLERDLLAATRGTRAVAEAAHQPGGLPIEDREVLYIELRDRPRQSRAA